jgi:hypothetical protein
MEQSANQPSDSAAQAPPKRRRYTPAPDTKVYARSKLSNGSDGAVLPNVDGRSLIARRFRDISRAIIVDQGKEAKCSEVRLQLIRRFAAAAVLAEQMEAQLAQGLAIDIQQHALLISGMVRVAQRIGIDRIPRNVATTLSEYLEPSVADVESAP